MAFVNNKHETLKKIVKSKIPPTKGEKPENTLVVIRHGATALNSESDEKFRGWADVPLSDEGRDQATEAGKLLKNSHIDGIITSDLGRTVETAERLAKEIGAPVLEKTKGLRPWHLGDLTGQPVKPNIPALQAYIKNPDMKVPGGESFNDFKKRMVNEVLKIQKKYPHDKIAIVTHHRGERLLQAWMDAGKPTDHMKLSAEPFMHKGIKPAGFTDFEIPPKKKLT